jgi:hypothetical protein
MTISEQVAEIMTANAARTQEMFRAAARHAQMYKRARNIWAFGPVEERAMEALLRDALTAHIRDKGAEQTLVSREFYAVLVTGRPPDGLTIQVLHPLADPLRTSPLALIPFGQWMTIGSQVPPE